jgi:hypothetical protein
MPVIHPPMDRTGVDLDSPPPSPPGTPAKPAGLLQGLAGRGPAPSFQGGGMGPMGGSPQTLVLSELMSVENSLKRIASVLPGTISAIGPMIDALRQSIPRALAENAPGAGVGASPLAPPPTPGQGMIPPPVPPAPLPSMGPQLGQAFLG